jgi:deazaflavin-dependent oxidoreductase (nitroreductase family)
MWFMNRIANPFVCLILRSPLHGMMSATLLLITYRGRKSGKEYTLPVQYVQNGNTIYIIPGTPEKKSWWRNLRGSAPVQILLRGQKSSGLATVFNGRTDTGLVAEALRLYLQRFPTAAKLHAIQPGADGNFMREDLQKVAASTLLVGVELDVK